LSVLLFVFFHWHKFGLLNIVRSVLVKTYRLFIGIFLCLFVGGNICAAAIAEPVATAANKNEPSLMLKPGQPLVAGMKTEDIVATYDVALAKEQVAAYPDSPEASFVLAVALTRTSMVEDALQEVRRARKLAEKQGGPAYFDHMINEYEEMLKSYPQDNRVRYGLAWAYYMKAYVLTHYAKANPAKPAGISNEPNWHSTWVNSLAQPQAQKLTTSKDTITLVGKQPAPAWAGLPPEIVPQVKLYYESALRNLDDLLAQEPNDMWARAYRAYLKGEYTGNLQDAMAVWNACLAIAPNNPAAYFFLGQGYLKQGNFKECLQNISKAVALRQLPVQ
jgi:tetratricopeptide (TPR) repeat protein